MCRVRRSVAAQSISDMYGEAAMKRFCDRGLINNPPHIYAMAEEEL